MPKSELYRVVEDQSGLAVADHTHSEADVLDLEHDAVKLQGQDVSDTAPFSGQVLTWNGSAWAPANAGGGGIPWITDIQDPPSLGWSWVNQGSATITDQISSGAGLYLEDGTLAASRNVRLRVRSAPSTPYSVEFGLYGNMLHDDVGCAAAFRDSGTGRIEVLYIRNRTSTAAAEVSLGQWFAPTSLFTEPLHINHYENSSLITFLKLEDDGTNRKYYFSVNGTNWIQVYSLGHLSFLTVDEVGFGVVFSTATAPSYNTGVGLVHYKEN